MLSFILVTDNLWKNIRKFITDSIFYRIFSSNIKISYLVFIV